MSQSLIPSQTALTLRRTDTLINLTHKLLAHTGVKSIHQMSNDELWQWWLGVDDEWKLFFLQYGLKLKLWQNNDWEFNKAYDYQADFDWLNRNLSLHYVKQLQGLTELDLSENQIQNISVLANLTQLTELWLYNNQIQDITPLANLTQLTRLSLWGNQIQDIAPLANLIQLTRLDLRYNQIQDIAPLTNLTQLTYLWLSDNQIQDITSLANLKNLKTLTLEHNPIHPQNIKWLQQQLPNCKIIF